MLVAISLLALALDSLANTALDLALEGPAELHLIALAKGLGALGLDIGRIASDSGDGDDSLQCPVRPESRRVWHFLSQARHGCSVGSHGGNEGIGRLLCSNREELGKAVDQSLASLRLLDAANSVMCGCVR